MKFLIVGLGNPGNEYAHTRHNIGFDVVNAFVQKHKGSFRVDRLAYVADVKWKGTTFVCVCPTTYMNLSGKAVKYWMDKEKISLEQVLVVVDDLALPLSKLRVKPSGSDAGHNGLKSLQEVLGTKDYPKLTFGIGNDYPDGWLRTGDVGSIEARGFVRISDRAKDVVKSGGEWISSLELEAALMEHPAVREVAVIAAPDQRWGERPLACVVTTRGASVSPEELREFLTGKLARWWLPEHWTFIDEVPRTSVGKYDKKLLRSRLADGELDVRAGGPAPGRGG